MPSTPSRATASMVMPRPPPTCKFGAPGVEADQKTLTRLRRSPGEPIGMQPMGQTNMNVGQKVTPLHLLSDRPEFVDCQMCEQRARTRVQQVQEAPRRFSSSPPT